MVRILNQKCVKQAINKYHLDYIDHVESYPLGVSFLSKKLVKLPCISYILSVNICSEIRYITLK